MLAITAKDWVELMVEGVLEIVKMVEEEGLGEDEGVGEGVGEGEGEGEGENEGEGVG